MIDSYIQLAVLPVKKDGKDAVEPNMPRSVRELSSLNLVPILTENMEVDHTCKYSEGFFPHFSHFKNEIKLVGGINAPKLLTAIDINGEEHLQLAKSGHDDLRQDAVMQQLFMFVNHLLKTCPSTRTRQLRIKTYNVIPLTPAAGIVEWVKDSIPLMKYLVDGDRAHNGAHRRLRPDDWTHHQCLSEMWNKTQKVESNVATKRRVFAKICENFKPVMHHFFLEYFLQASEWFQRRLAYARLGRSLSIPWWATSWAWGTDTLQTYFYTRKQQKSSTLTSALLSSRAGF